MIQEASSILDRIRAAVQPDIEGVKDFILNKTYLNGKRFSLKNHDFQRKILEIVASPDIDLVIQKPSQVGISEIVYRVLLSYMYRIRGFSAAITFPVAKMSNEVMSTRVRQIIDDSVELSSQRNSDVDSNSVKMFRNGSILYALGASPQSKSTVINRPIRMIVADELARCDIGVITALRSRQRHQEHKSSIYFSTPLFEKFDIDAEMDKCGVIWEQVLKCRRCGHYFFPDFFNNCRLPGYTDPIKFLTQDDTDRKNLNMEDSFLCCPKCERAIPFEYEDMEWVDTSEYPQRPKEGVRLSAFAMPAFVKVPDMMKDYVAYSDKNEFIQQVLGKPAAKSDTTMDTSKIVFEQQDPGALNVFGLDVGKTLHLSIGTVTTHNLYIHTRIPISLKDIHTELPKYMSQFNCVAGVIDLMPYTDVTMTLINKYPNSWAAIYNDPAVVQPELFKLKVKEDEAIGRVKLVQINKNMYIDHYVNSLMDGSISFSLDHDRPDVLAHHEAMRRVRNPKFVEVRYHWVKPYGSKTQDHWFHSAIYCSVAARLMIKSAAGSLPLTTMLSGFRLKHDL